jgi:predicted  nucleic acid-binding Zn-ribbon protein
MDNPHLDDLAKAQQKLLEARRGRVKKFLNPRESSARDDIVSLTDDLVNYQKCVEAIDRAMEDEKSRLSPPPEASDFKPKA